MDYNYLDFILTNENDAWIRKYESIFGHLSKDKLFDPPNLLWDVKEAKNKPTLEKILREEKKGRNHFSFIIDTESSQLIDEQYIDSVRKAIKEKYLVHLLFSQNASVFNPRELTFGIRETFGLHELSKKLSSITDLLLLRAKPLANNANDAILFRPLENEEEMVDYYSKRFLVWNRLGFINEQFFSPSSQLEIDEYDKYSIPLGGFSAHSGDLVVMSRIIRNSLQEKYQDLTDRVVRKYGERQNLIAHGSRPETTFPSFQDAKKNDFYNSLSAFIQDWGGAEKTVEFSRMIVADPAYKGFKLSKKMGYFHNFYAHFFLQATLGLVECWVKHIDHYVKSNGFNGTVPTVGIMEGNRNERAGLLYVDLDNFINDASKNQLQNAFTFFNQHGFLCYCENDCSIKKNDPSCKYGDFKWNIRKN